MFCCCFGIACGHAVPPAPRTQLFSNPKTGSWSAKADDQTRGLDAWYSAWEGVPWHAVQLRIDRPHPRGIPRRAPGAVLRAAHHSDRAVLMAGPRGTSAALRRDRNALIRARGAQTTRLRRDRNRPIRARGAQTTHLRRDRNRPIRARGAETMRLHRHHNGGTHVHRARDSRRGRTG
jgi:hypothetical protein